MQPVRVVKQWFTSRIIGELHRYLHADDKQFCRTYDPWMTREKNMLRTMHVLRSENVNAPKRKTRDGYFSFSKRESPIALYIYFKNSLIIHKHMTLSETSNWSRAWTMVILKSQGRDLISVPGKSGVECLNNTIIAEFLMRTTTMIFI